jgi:hypothetical protein
MSQYAGADWLRGYKKTLSPLGEKVGNLLGELFAGIYHIDKEVLKADFSDKQQVRVCVRDNDFATYDSSTLTKLVFLCHERNVRVSIKAAAHGYLWLDFVEVDRHGFFADRHPTLAESMKRFGIEA